MEESLEDVIERLEKVVDGLVVEQEIFKVYLEEAALKHAFLAFKSEYRARLEKKAIAEEKKQKMKEANDTAAQSSEEIEEEIEIVHTESGEVVSAEEAAEAVGVNLIDEPEDGSINEAEELSDELPVFENGEELDQPSDESGNDEEGEE